MEESRLSVSPNGRIDRSVCFLVKRKHRRMKTFLVLLLALCGLAVVVPAQESVPTIRILPEDIVQTSIKQLRSPGGTNKFTVMWQYTETGAKKMLAFWRAHAGEKVG